MGRKKATPKAPLEVTPEPEETNSQPRETEEKSTPSSSKNSISTSTSTYREPVKVNKYNLTELKNACDDCLKKYLSRPESFQEQHTHTDVKLVLGYASILIGGGATFYAWQKSDFEATKPIVLIGVTLYFILTALQNLYAWYIEQNTVFVGKRKTLDKRILTERLTVSSKTIKSTETTPPAYSVDITYLHSSNGGKTVIKSGKETAQKEYNALFDEDGQLSLETLEGWVEGLVSRATSS